MTENVQVTEIAAGTRVSEGIVSVVPGEGWSQSTEVPGLLLLKRPEAVMLFAAPESADGRSAIDVVTKNAEIFTTMDADPSRTIGEAEPFNSGRGSTAPPCWSRTPLPLRFWGPSRTGRPW